MPDDLFTPGMSPKLWDFLRDFATESAQLMRRGPDHYYVCPHLNTEQDWAWMWVYHAADFVCADCLTTTLGPRVKQEQVFCFTCQDGTEATNYQLAALPGNQRLGAVVPMCDFCLAREHHAQQKWCDEQQEAGDA